MNIRRFSRFGVAAALALAATTVYAGSDAGSGLTIPSSHNHSVYGKAGFLGAGLGYAYGINERFTVRGEFTTIGSYSRDMDIGSFNYDLKLRNNVATVALDFFPFDNGFRVTGGLGFRDTRLTGVAQGGPGASFKGVALSSEDSLYGKVKWPSVSPYLGIGWGHNNGQHAKAGWGFVADAGVYFGRPKVSLTANDSAMAKLDTYTGGNGQALIDQEVGEWKDKIGKYKVVPALYVGVSYRF